MINENFKVLVITLYSGENEYEECLSALRLQNYKYVDLFSIENKPNYEAHCELYKKIEDNQHIYDLFLKVDADMILRTPDVIGRIVSIFKGNMKLDHAIFTVYDWASETNIIGMHAFSNRAKWGTPNDRLFVDPSPVIEGERKLYKGEGPVADHMPDPTDLQAYVFGYHRAIKIIQSKKSNFSRWQYRYQYKLLQNVWQAYQRNLDKKRYFVLAGAEDAFDGEADSIEEKLNIRTNHISSVSRKYTDSYLGRRWNSKGYFFYLSKWRWVWRREFYYFKTKLMIFLKK